MKHKRKITKRAVNMQRASMRAVGAGLGLAAAATGLAYVVGTRGGKKIRRSAAHIGGELRRDVMSRARKVGTTTERAYHSLVDEAARSYERMSDVDARELRVAVRKMKGEWRAFGRDVGSAVKKTRRIVRHALRKAKR